MALHQAKQLVVANALVRDIDGNIFFQKRHDPDLPAIHNKWEFPGGLIDFGENPEEALIRECMEEMQCEIAIDGLIPIIQTRIWKSQERGEYQIFVWCYDAHIVSGTPNSDGDAYVSDTLWQAPEEIATLELVPGLEEFITHSNYSATVSA